MKALRERMAAKVERDVARARLLGTAGEVRKATAPSALAELAKGAALSKLLGTAAKSGKAVTEKPHIIAGAFAGVALYLFRKPLIAALSRWRNKETDHDRTE